MWPISTENVKQKGNQLQIREEMSLRKRVYEAADWNGFKDAVSAHKAFANDLLVFKAE